MKPNSWEEWVKLWERNDPAPSKTISWDEWIERIYQASIKR